MVPVLFCDDMCPRLKKTHMQDYWPHTPLLWASQLQVAGCCPTEVMLVPWLLAINVSLKDSTTRHRTENNTWGLVI
jgi:hypothetical protein